MTTVLLTGLILYGVAVTVLLSTVLLLNESPKLFRELKRWLGY